MQWFDQLPKVRRDFINAYGAMAYQRWKQSKMPMRNFEIMLREEMHLSPSSPVFDEHNKSAT